jgi:hypothetical protein
MKVADIANEIFLEAGSPTYTTEVAIEFWVRSKIGAINSLLFETFALTGTPTEVTHADGSEISMDAAAIIKQLYRCYDLDVQVRQNMNALASQGVIMAQDGDTKVQRVNRNEVSKTLASIKKEEMIFLDKLVNAHRSASSPPSSIAGDDDQQGYYNSQNHWVRNYN